MKVTEVMTKSPASCSRDTNLGTAVEIMWSRNCGFLPIVSSDEAVVGVITDRDMSIALATRNRLPGDITVQEISAGTIYSCKPDDDIRTALGTMAKKKVRRLPVVDSAGMLNGVLSIADIVLHADSRTEGSLSSQEIVSTLRELYSAEVAQPQKRVATA